MKLLFIIILFPTLILSQTYTRLNDKAIVGQHKRMVYSKWGDWYPKPKYFLGVQTNIPYALIWGGLAPSRNRRYRRGNDLRPLKPGGVEMQRLTFVNLEESQVKHIKYSVDSIYEKNISEFIHWQPLTVDADPLWLLYYKKMLKPLKDMPDNPQNYQEWYLSSNELYYQLNSNGGIQKLQERLDLLKEKYEHSRTLSMPRGKRMLMYQETLMEWRDFVKYIESLNSSITLKLKLKNKLQSFRGNTTPIENFADDKFIVLSVMQRYQYTLRQN